MENLREKTKGGDVKDGKRMGRNRKKWRTNLNRSHKTERSIFRIYKKYTHFKKILRQQKIDQQYSRYMDILGYLIKF